MGRVEEEQEKEISLLEILQLIRHRYYLIIITTLLSLGLSLAYTTSTYTPNYSATSSMVINSQQLKQVGGQVIEYNDLSLSLKMVHTYEAILLSDRVLSRVIETLGIDLPIERLRRSIEISSQKETDVILVTVTSEAPRLSSQIADTIITIAPEIIAQTLEIGSVTVLDHARVPEMPVPKNYSLPAAIGLLLGLFIGVLLVFLLSMLNPTILSHEDISGRFGIPLITTVPFVRKKDVDASRLHEEHTDYALCRQPVFSYLESHRMLALHLHHHQSLHAGKRILVTSALPQEGKTSVALNTAISLSLQGKRVILLDCDLYQRSLSSICKNDRSEGLADLLAEPERLEELIVQDPERGVDLLCAGTSRSEKELFHSNEFALLLERLEEDYDAIIMDTPPVKLLSDAYALSRCADGILFVIREDHATTSQISHAITTLKRFASIPIAAVYNGFSLPSQHYYQKYGEYGNQERKQKEPSLKARITTIFTTPLFAWTLTALMFALIGLFSMSPGDTMMLYNEKGSSRIYDAAVKLESIFGLSEDQSGLVSTLIDDTEQLARFEQFMELAIHLILFALLTALVYHALGTLGLSSWVRNLLTLLLSIAVAVLNELIQEALIAGRGFELVDIITESMGIVLGMSICVLLACRKTAEPHNRKPRAYQAQVKPISIKQLHLIRTIHPISEDIL